MERLPIPEPSRRAFLLAPWLVLLARPAFSMEPPEIFRGIYLTNWSAGSETRVERVIELAKATPLNAVVIDIKDATGYVGFDTSVPQVKRYQAGRRTIRDLAALSGRFHKAGLYVIARIVVFQDPRLALARPNLAVHNKSLMTAGGALTSGTLWLDNRKLAWIDPAAREAWEYDAAIGRDALDRGVDELNFDYVRFPSDGNLNNMYFPLWDGVTPKHVVIREFFSYLRRTFPQARLSADLFGLTTVKHDDLGVGQQIEDACRYFDYVCPMVYPSHYPATFLGYKNPAEHPYEVVRYSLDSAVERLRALQQEGGSRAELRPWLQAFNLGAIYDTRMIRAQIEATQDALGSRYAGFTFWNPSNVYTAASLESRPILSEKEPPKPPPGPR